MVLEHLKVSSNQKLSLYRLLQWVLLFASYVTVPCRPTDTIKYISPVRIRLLIQGPAQQLLIFQMPNETRSISPNTLLCVT